MIKQVLVIREPEQQLPEAFKTKLLESCSTAFGYAVPTGEEILKDVFSADEYDLADALKTVDENPDYKKSRVFYWFLSDPENTLNYDCFQPLSLNSAGDGDNEQHLLMVMCEGEFAKHNTEQPDEQMFSNEYRFVNEVLKKKIDEYLDIISEDASIERLMVLLDKPPFRKVCQEAMAPRGNILIIPCVGNQFTSCLTTDKRHGAWRWGWTSDSLGYSEGSQKTEDVVVGKVENAKPLTKREQAEAARLAKAKEALTPTADSVEVTYAKVLKHPHNHFFSVKNNVLWCRPPKDARFKTAVEWWSNNCVDPRAQTGDDTKDAVAIYAGFPASKLKVNSPLKDFIENTMNPKKQKPAEAGSVQGPAKPEEKKEEEKNAEPTLFIDSKFKTNFINQEKAGRFPLTNYDTLKEITKATPKCTEQIAYDFNKILLWTPKAFQNFINSVGYHPALTLMHELRMENLAMREKLGMGAPTIINDEPEEKKEAAPAPAAPAPSNPNASKKKLVIPKAA